MSIVAATIASWHWAVSPGSIEAMGKIRGIDDVYIGYQDKFGQTEDKTQFNLDLPVPYTVERWAREGWDGSEAEPGHEYRRLYHITAARNFAIDYAIGKGHEWLLFIDNDVYPEPDALEYLLKINKPLCGGYVQSREYSILYYVYPGSMADPEWELPIEICVVDGEIVKKCGFATCGFMLIHSKIFTRLRFRHNCIDSPGNLSIAEDPAYCMDAIRNGLTDAMYVHTKARAMHYRE